MAYQGEGGPYPQYPQYPPTYPPPPPPPPRRPSRWPAFATNQGVLLYIVAPLAALLLIFALVAGVASALQRAQAAGTPSSQQQPTLVPYPTVTTYPTSTATSPPAPMVDSATLGGTSDAFTAAYGTEVSPDTWQSTIAGQTVQIMVDFSHESDSADGTPRAVIINATTPSVSGWGPTTSAKIAAAFLPPDAHFTGATPGPSGHTDENYRSALLATSLVASIFTTDDGSRQVTPGSLYWACDQATGCYISVGSYN